MPRYYFDTLDGDMIPDDVGVDCDDFRAALDEATSALADFAQDAIPIPGAKLQEIAVHVRDEHGRPVMQAILRLEIKTSD